MESEAIKQAWMEVFPNSYAASKTVMGSTCIRLYIQNPDQWSNGISDNDPLTYRVWIEGDNVRESDLHILTRPPEGKNLVYGSAKMRKQTIKSADYDKMVKRFRKVRDFIMAQDMKHDISDK